ncbi:MAG: UDP-N-acetylmuramoyl-tripeptide--D-alanyl-D-alanine ligase [Tenacibaculum sp.]
MDIGKLYKLYSKNYKVDTDSRSIRKGSVFFALKGSKFNGNKFAEQALKNGAAYAIIDQKEYQTHSSMLLVNNVLKTLQALAKFHRKQLAIPVIAITGSNGKTTTKELTKAVLNKKYNVLATKGNLNNHIGVPLTLLSLKPDTEIGLVELGANRPKEIAFLTDIVKPDYGLITNFGKAHLKGFGSVKGVIEAKSELYDFIKKQGKTVFVNPADSVQMEKTKNIKRVVLNNSLKYLNALPFVRLSYKDQFINSCLIGKYNYTNIAFAISIGEYFKVPDQEIKLAIENYMPKNNRAEIVDKGKIKIILDAYNANPSSMKCSLESFSQSVKGSKIAILGDMFELGKASKIEHQKIADYLTSLKIDDSYLVGDSFFKTNTRIKKFNNCENLIKHLKKDKPITAGTLLIKGSRAMALEKLINYL